MATKDKDFKNIFSEKRKHSSLGAQKKTFVEEIYPDFSFWADCGPSLDLDETKAVTSVCPPVSRSENEKVETLKSLRNFAEEKLQSDLEKEAVELSSDGPSKVYKFPGGEVKVNSNSKSGVAGDFSFIGQHLVELFKSHPETPEQLNSYVQLLSSQKALDVLFVGDSHQGDQDEKEVDLLAKMIAAMKIPLDKVGRLPLLEKPSDLSLPAIIYSVLITRPKVIISLGAKATHVLMAGKKERLARIHGKFYSLSMSLGNLQTVSSEQSSEFVNFIHNLEQSSEVSQKVETKLVPLFHPDFLVINPNMKAAAWSDLQKVMAFLAE